MEYRRLNPWLFISIGYFLFFETMECGYNTTFEWQATPWSGCVYREQGSCCKCKRTRDISCVYKDSSTLVPPFYCRKLGTDAPVTEQHCSPCEQDCVLSDWSDWSDCSTTCTPSTRYRSRRVLLLPSSGGKTCENLAEQDECRDLPLCTFIDPRPRHSWRIGYWTSCRQITNTSDCGTGARHRDVTCVDQNSQPVAEEFCKYYMPEEHKPVEDESCPLACDCQLSEWSEWGACSKSCYKGSIDGSGYQARTRHVVRPPQLGGVGCPSVKETRPCDKQLLPSCVRYIWHGGTWSECWIERVSGSYDCGSGVQSRQVTCTREGDPTLQPRDNKLCEQDAWYNEKTSSAVEPNERRACEVPCPRDCQLGEWQNWSQCTKSCGQGGVRIRVKPVLVEATAGGAVCGTKLETTGCETVPCSWWHTGRWSTCFLDGPLNSQCGGGTQIRSVFCLSSLDDVLPDDDCSIYGPKPVKEQSCKVPCNSECLVSDWSKWTECSVTCGRRGGSQFRRRKILDQRSGPNPCLKREDLEQSQICNQVSCRSYLWQVTSWSPCIRMDDASSPCGPGTGRQTRTAHCEMDPGREGFPVNQSNCASQPSPVLERTCSAPCPKDCELTPWSEWSGCSLTCGRESRKIRSRRILKLALHGGIPCPAEADINGVIIHDKRCKKVPPCNEHGWETSDWGMCTTLRGCGRGARARNVSCIRDKSRALNDDVCYEELIEARPPSAEACYQSCRGDCILGDWLAWSPCSQTCGETPGTKTRTRQVLNPDPYIPLASQCPSLSPEELEESMPCGEGTCPSYTWETGKWGHCLVHQRETQTGVEPIVCGDGVERRHVFCRRGDDSHVPEHHCDAVTSVMPDKHRPCQVGCPEDCDVTLWSAWSRCSQPCGNGLKNRVRAIAVHPTNGGRPCPRLEETTTCSSRDCDLFIWHVTEWSECQAFYGMPCGRGRRYRQVTCPAGTQYEYECENRQPKLISFLECDVPCEGDCELSDWSEWSSCSCASNSTTTRSREVITQATENGAPCGPTVETKPCVCPIYKLEVGSWTSCQLTGGFDATCGHGVKHRPINCIRNDGALMSLSHCLLGNTTLTEPCQIHCPEDCHISQHSPWSQCSHTCGIKAMKSRMREIVRESNEHGRPCPDSSALSQTTPCHTGPCYTYQWSHGSWQPCSVSQTECGMGIMMRDVLCVRNDQVSVEDVYCLEQEDLSLRRVLRLSELSAEEKAALDIETDAVCGSPCPGACQLSDWSEWGPCFQECGDGRSGGLQFRSRVIIKTPQNGGKCPRDLIETKKCPGKEALCPLFAWEAGKWNKNGKRKVFCSLQGGTRVTSGCIPDHRPSTHEVCQKDCGDYATCLDGHCVCDNGFRGDGHTCLPDYVCVTHNHCVINNTFCDPTNKECLCWDATLPTEALQCPPAEVAASDRDDIEGLNELFVYILIGCLILLLILALIATCFLIKRRRKPDKNKYNYKVYNSPTLTKIDNLESNQKNNEVSADTPLMYKPVNRPEDKNLSHDPSKKSPFSTYQSNLSGPEDKDHMYTPTPTVTPKKANVEVNIALMDLDQDLFRDPDESESHTMPKVVMRRPRRDMPDSRGHGEQLHPAVSPQTAAQPATIIRVPSSRSIGSESNPRLSTFKPDPSPPPEGAPLSSDGGSPEQGSQTPGSHRNPQSPGTPGTPVWVKQGARFPDIEPQPGRSTRMPQGYTDDPRSTTLPRRVQPGPTSQPSGPSHGSSTLGSPGRHPGSPPYRARRADQAGQSPQKGRSSQQSSSTAQQAPVTSTAQPRSKRNQPQTNPNYVPAQNNRNPHGRPLYQGSHTNPEPQASQPYTQGNSPTKQYLPDIPLTQPYASKSHHKKPAPYNSPRDPIQPQDSQHQPHVGGPAKPYSHDKGPIQPQGPRTQPQDGDPAKHESLPNVPVKNKPNHSRGSSQAQDPYPPTEGRQDNKPQNNQQETKSDSQNSHKPNKSRISNPPRTPPRQPLTHSAKDHPPASSGQNIPTTPPDQKPKVPPKPQATRRPKVVPLQQVAPKPPTAKPVASPTGEVQYSPEETANLLEYCDELLADLERVANS